MECICACIVFVDHMFFISKDLCIATGEGYDASVNVRPINHDAIVDF
jgi:hypothetical protein